MVKVIVGVLVLAGIALGVVYLAGGYTNLDPTKQGRQAKAAIKPGMTAAQVIKAIGAPKTYSIFAKVTKTVRGEKSEVVEEGPTLDFDEKVFSNDLAAKNMPEGFNFFYIYSHQSAFSVTFTATGIVESIQDVRTMADLLGTRGGG